MKCRLAQIKSNGRINEALIVYIYDENKFFDMALKNPNKNVQAKNFLNKNSETYSNTFFRN